MDLFLMNESSNRGPSGKLVTIALIGVASLLCTPRPSQSSPKPSPRPRRSNQTANNRTPHASQRV
jgi:hypothetical protein